MKIISLLPSATEIVYALGLGDSLEAVTFECDHPAEARTKPVVSNTALPQDRPMPPAEVDRRVHRVAPDSVEPTSLTFSSSSTLKVIPLSIAFAMS